METIPSMFPNCKKQEEKQVMYHTIQVITFCSRVGTREFTELQRGRGDLT